MKRMDQQAEKKKKSNRIGKKNKTVDSKVESNDSPNIPDRGGDVEHPRPPFGGRRGGEGEKGE